jgi:hypothetical protein
MNHNHMTRDIKKPGVCPGCDEYHARHRAYIDIVFAAPPGPGNECVFVEVEDERGRSISVGEWVDRGDGFWALRLPRGLT